MAENVFTKYGGKVKFTPERVKSDIGPVEFTDEDQIRNIALQRDLTAANLLENDILLDTLDAAIDDQMKDFALTVPELYDAASSLCGSPTVTWECYKKAKELLRIAPWVAYGYDPVQLTFTDRLQKRVGNVVFDCKQFNADTFQNTGFDPLAAVDEFTGNDPNTESPSAIEKRATENQKKWALLVLFWDLLWGKAVVKPGLQDEESKQLSIDYINETIQKLREDSQDTSVGPDGKTPKFSEDQKKGFATQADNLAKKLVQSKNLPNTVMLDRPKITNQLQWSDSGGSPLETNLNMEFKEYITKPVGVKEMRIYPEDVHKDKYPWHPNAVATWVDFASIFTKDLYKDKSIPAIKSGFILSILEGFLGLPPKVCFYFIKLRFEFLLGIKWMKTKKILGVKVFNLSGASVWKLLKLVINIIVAIPIMINTIFLEICIWLALIPNLYVPNVSDIESVPMSDTGVSQAMDVLETPAGFVSMDCFVAAQEIANRVNAEAVTNG